MFAKLWISSLVCILFATGQTFSQWYMGGGVNISGTINKPPVVSSKIHIGWLYNTGVRIPFGRDSRFAVHPQFQLNGMGYRTANNGSVSSYNFEYLSIPVGLNYRPLSKWWLNAGIQWNVPLSYSSTANKGGKTRSLKLDMKNRFSLYGGIDYIALPLLSIGIRYERHLSSLHRATVVNPDGTLQVESFPIRLHGAYLIVRVNFSKLMQHTQEQ